jgi:hypothetical protein
MFWLKAYDRRQGLSDAELERLLSTLKEQVKQYRDSIRNYPPDRMERFGQPFLDDLDERVKEVTRLLAERAAPPT